MNRSTRFSWLSHALAVRAADTSAWRVRSMGTVLHSPSAVTSAIAALLASALTILPMERSPYWWMLRSAAGTWHAGKREGRVQSTIVVASAAGVGASKAGAALTAMALAPAEPLRGVRWPCAPHRIGASHCALDVGAAAVWVGGFGAACCAKPPPRCMGEAGAARAAATPPTPAAGAAAAAGWGAWGAVRGKPKIGLARHNASTNRGSAPNRRRSVMAVGLLMSFALSPASAPCALSWLTMHGVASRTHLLDLMALSVWSSLLRLMAKEPVLIALISWVRHKHSTPSG